MNLVHDSIHGTGDPTESSALHLQPGSRVRARRDVFCLVLLALLWVVPFFGHRPLANPDEGRYAEIPREMAASGDWVTPRLDGVKYFEKPPLMYWVEAAVLRLGGSEEWILRAPVALFALAGCLLVYRASRRLFGREVALLSALVLASSLFYWAMAELLILDMAVSVFLSATLLLFIVAMETPPGTTRRILFYGVYASAALATLTKGLMGFLIPGAVIFVWLLAFNQWKRLRPFYLFSGTALFLAIAAPWHVLVGSRNPEWAQFYFVHEHWLRFTTTVHRRAEPWWFFIPLVLLGLFPWAGFLVPAAASALARKGGQTRSVALPGFFVVWAGFIFLFFSASGSKLPPYILPIFPALAVLIGRWLATATVARRAGWRWGWITFAAFALVLGGAFVAAAIRPSLLHGNALDGVRPLLASLAAIILVSAIAVLYQAYRQNHGRAVLFALVASVLFQVGVTEGVVMRLDFASTLPLARIVRRDASPDDEIFHYRALFHDFLYYTERPVGLVDGASELEIDLDAQAASSGRFIDFAAFLRRWDGPKQVWLVLRRDDLPQLEAHAGFAGQICGETGRFILMRNHPAP